MAILVLVVGAVMFVAGAAEIFYGSGMIEIERGWSAFIAGSVLLAGGVLTMALGLAVRALMQVKGVLLQLGGLADAGAAAPHSEIAPPARAPVPLRDAEPAMQLDGPGAQIEPHFGAAPAAAIEATEMPPLRLREEPGRSSPPPAPSAPAEPQVEAADDWLEQEFADIRRETAQRHGGGDQRFGEQAGTTAGHATPAADAPPADHPAEDVYADYVELPAAEPQAPAPTPVAAEPPPAAPRPAATPAPAVAPPAAPPAPPQSAVIGRYEADGTSYVMFADGSIEAQSEAGVYRFASMAELKSFIET